MNIEQYIERIGYKDHLIANHKCLSQLHKYHVMSVPFEAIDVELGNRIDLNLRQIFKKVIIKNRGGYCYELNYLFHSLLNRIGFENHLISARIFDSEKYGPEHDHMVIVVNLNGLWLVDVGYGDLFIEPIKIESGYQQEDHFKLYKIEKTNTEKYILYESLKNKVDFKIKYQFNIRPRLINEFDEQNSFKQSSNESYFVKNRICTLPTKLGRKTILNNTYKVRTRDKVDLKEISSNEELNHLLVTEFNIILQHNQIDR